MKNWNDTPLASLVYQDALTDTERLLLSVICERIDETIQNLRHEHSLKQLAGMGIIEGKTVSDILGEIKIRTQDLGISLNEFNAESAMSGFANITVFRRQPVGFGGPSLQGMNPLPMVFHAFGIIIWHSSLSGYHAFGITPRGASSGACENNIPILSLQHTYFAPLNIGILHPST